jgi:hypothetical protein
MEKPSSPIINKPVFWERHPTNQRYFYAQDDGELLLLRQNDFPDEPYWTLIKGMEIIDLEETPDNWVVPF